MMAEGLSLVFWALVSIGAAALGIGSVIFAILFREQERKRKAREAEMEREGVQTNLLDALKQATTGTAPSIRRSYPPVTVQGLTARRRAR
jgi:predicted phage-related endonuclease